jgi:uncharacterized membrane-anchored protein YjiN (DUF445 family)
MNYSIEETLRQLNKDKKEEALVSSIVDFTNRLGEIQEDVEEIYKEFRKVRKDGESKLNIDREGKQILKDVYDGFNKVLDNLSKIQR